MAFQKPQYSKKKSSQKFNISDLLGVSVKGNLSLRLAVGQAIMDKMLDRTADGLDIGGRSFTKYSSSYKESVAFRRHGKSSSVDMDLKGSMLSDVDVRNLSANQIEIHISDAKEALKSLNHNTGDTLPKRQFFGMRLSDLAFLKGQFSADIDSIKKKEKLKQTAKSKAAATLLAAARKKTSAEVFKDSFISREFDRVSDVN